MADMQKVRTNISVFLSKLLSSVPFVFMGTFLFIALLFIPYFYQPDYLVSIAFLFYAAGMVRVSLPLSLQLKNYALFLVIGIISTLASLHPIAALLVNFVSIFFFYLWYADDLKPRNAYIYWIAAAFLQRGSQVSLAILPSRLAGLLFCCLFSLLFTEFMKKIKQIHTLDMLATKAAALLRAMLLETDAEAARRIRTQIHTLIHTTCDIIYATVCKQDGRMNEKEFHTITLLMYIEETADQPHAFDHNILEELLAAQKAARYRIATQPPLKQRLMQKYSLYKANFRPASSQFRFAFRVALTVSLCFFLSFLWDFPNSYWIPLMALTMTAPYRREEQIVILQRVLGTLAGILVFLVFTQFLPDSTRVYIALFAGFTIMLATSSLVLNVICGTQMAIAGAFAFGMFPAIGYRLGTVLIAAALVFICNLLFAFPEHQQAEQACRQLDDIAKQLNPPYSDTLLLKKRLLQPMAQKDP